MKLQNFMKTYHSEEACREAFYRNRLKSGVTCKKCNCKEHYWLSTIEQFKCKSCGFKTTLRSGTALEASKLPFSYWFIAMFLMTMTKKSISAHEMRRQLGHKRYEPIWLMMHKIRRVMGNRDDAHKLHGPVEIDEGFFETVNITGDKEERKRGRGSQKQTTVLVMAESVEVLNPKSGRKSRKCGYFKMRVIDNLSSETINEEVESAVDSKASALTDQFPSYNNLKNILANHRSVKCLPEDAGILLPWVHTAISNAKRNLLCAYHRINGIYLQNYLDEFCYRLNRRYFGQFVFERVLFAASAAVWYM